MQVKLETKGLKELIQRLQDYPDKLHQGMQKGMEDTLLVMAESIPPYPPQIDPIQGPQAAPVRFTTKGGINVEFIAKVPGQYRRTGTLGRTLGSSVEGGASGGKADIYEIRGLGSAIEGHFGTNLKYAPYVIGDHDQAKIHQGRWWTLSKVKDDALPKIQRIWQYLADAMAKFAEGHGL